MAEIDRLQVQHSQIEVAELVSEAEGLYRLVCYGMDQDQDQESVFCINGDARLGPDGQLAWTQNPPTQPSCIGCKFNK